MLKLSNIVATLAVTATCALFAQSANAATLSVCSSGGAYTSVQAAVDDASDDDIIQLCNETFTGAVVIDKRLTIEPSAGRPVLDAGSADSAIRVTASGDATLKSLSITGASVSAGAKNEGRLVLEDVWVYGNHATYGGVLNYGALEVLSNSAITGNTSTSFWAGGVNNFGGIANIQQATFLTNSGYHGGGLCNVSGHVTIHASSFTGNSAYLGGGIHNSYGDLIMTASSFSTNYATSIGGGWSNHNIGGTVTMTGVGYAANDTGSGHYLDFYDVN